jgi:hypothetical protein
VSYREDFDRFVMQVAQQLDGEWDYAPNPPDWNVGGHLTSEATRAILYFHPNFRINEDAPGQKITIKAQLPKNKNGKEPHVSGDPPSITVSATKTPVQVAREVERRLWPSYAPILQKALERIARHDEHVDRSEDTLEQISGIVGVRARPKSREISLYDSPVPALNQTVSSAEVSGDEVTLTLHLGRARYLRWPRPKQPGWISMIYESCERQEFHDLRMWTQQGRAGEFQEKAQAEPGQNPRGSPCRICPARQAADLGSLGLATAQKNALPPAALGNPISQIRK